MICPIGFVADHVEVLYDLDHDAAGVCRELKLPMARAAGVNDDPLFLDMMADLVQATHDRYRIGRPLPVIAADGPERIEGPPPARRPTTAQRLS